MIKLLVILLTLISTNAVSKTITLSTRNTVVLEDMVDAESVIPVITRAYRLSFNLDRGEPLYLVLNTPGGDVQYGNIMIQALNGIGRPIHTITIQAMSMGFHTVQGLDGRYLIGGGILMSHRASGGVDGEIPGSIFERLHFWHRYITELDRVAVSRTDGKYTIETYMALIRDEYWCHGQECVDAGFADEVVDVKCDESFFQKGALRCPMIPRG